jgi:hypothetical protein
MRARTIKNYILLAVGLYIVYRLCIAKGTEGEGEGIREMNENGFQDDATPHENENFIIGFFDFFFGGIGWCLRAVWWVCTLAVSVLSFLWSIIHYIWSFVVLIINGVYFLMAHQDFKRSGRNNQPWVFLQALFFFIIVPLAFNMLLTYRTVALQLILPISMALLADCLSPHHAISGNSIRNMVFFMIICAFL